MAELTPQRFRALTKEKINKIASENPQQLISLVNQMKELVVEQAGKIYSRGHSPIAYENLRLKNRAIFDSKVSTSPTTQKAIAISLLNTYKSKTMTVKGAEEYARKQDVAIFGYEYHLTSTGLHYKTYAHRMTPEERYIFWAVYNEIQDESNEKSSDVLLQAIQSELVERKNNNEKVTYSDVLNNLMKDGEFDRSFIQDTLDEINTFMGFPYS